MGEVHKNNIVKIYLRVEYIYLDPVAILLLGVLT